MADQTIAELTDLSGVLAALATSPAFDGWDVRLLTPGEPAPIDLAAGTQRALEKPLGSPRLAELAHGKRSAVIVTSDATRAVPNRVLLPLVVEELRAGGIADDSITVMVGTGAHRPLAPAELDELLGSHWAGRLRVLNHDAHGETVAVGTTRRGNEVRVSRAFAEAEVRLALGLVEPHEFAGFTGGRKAVLPAVAAYETIIRNHSLELMSHPLARPGVLNGNPIHEEMAEAARLAGLHFIVNVTLDRELRPLAVAAGDPDAAHAELVRFVKRYARVEPPAEVEAPDEPPDLIVTGPGRPLDINLYQSVKPLVAVEPWTGRDTTTVLLSRCWDGTGSAEMLEAFAGGAQPAEVLRRLASDYTIEKDHAYFIARFRARCPRVVACCPGVAEADLRVLGFDVAASVEEASGRARGPPPPLPRPPPPPPPARDPLPQPTAFHPLALETAGDHA